MKERNLPNPTSSVSKKWKIHLVMLVEAPPMEEAREGIMEGFKQSGLIEGRDFEMTMRNAQGDMPTLISIMDSVVVDKSDMVMTITTPALQTAVQKIKDRPIVFSLAVNPASWGGAKNDREHLPNMTGVYVSMPFQRMIDVIRDCFPRARRIGTLFSPGETNSVYVKDVFEGFVQKNNLKLVAVPVTSTVEIKDAAGSLLAKDIDVFCQIADSATSAGFPGIVRAAQDARVPLFGFSTYQAKQGALVTVSNDYFDVGRESAQIAARVLKGESPAGIPLQSVRTVKIALNMDVSRALNFPLPESLIKAADEIVDMAHPDKKVETTGLSRKWNIHLIEYTNILDVEDSERGIRDGFQEAGLHEGRDYTLKVSNAQGDMVTVSTLVDTAITDGADLLMTMSTPALQAALRRAGKTPIVFTLLASAVAAGAGKSNEDHLPNVTGVVTTSAYDELMSVVRECMPHAKRIGTLFVTSETNSIYNKDRTMEAAAKYGFELISVPVSTSAEASDAALSLTGRDIEAICQIAGNLTASSFPSIVQAARKERLPIFAFQSNQAFEGASVVVARDYFDGGRESALMAVRVMRGEDPSKIPFEHLKTTRLLVNKKAGAESGLRIPESVLKRATRIIE